MNAEQTAALTDASKVITRQEGEKKFLDEIITYKDRALKAKDDALLAERDANMKLHTALQLSKDRVEDLTSDLRTQRKLTKWAFIGGLAAGFSAAFVLSK